MRSQHSDFAHEFGLENIHHRWNQHQGGKYVDEHDERQQQPHLSLEFHAGQEIPEDHPHNHGRGGKKDCLSCGLYGTGRNIACVFPALSLICSARLQTACPR